MNHPQISVLIPAAGASRRLGQPKQLVRYQTRTLIQNAVDIALSIDPQEVIVVTGANEKAVKGAVQHGQVRWIHNSNWSDGMGSSIATGASIISPESAGVMILLCDQWRLQTPDLHLIVSTWQSNPERIVCAQVKSQNTPPVIFPVCFLGRLQALRSDSGARKILTDHPELLKPVALKNALFDLDTQTQLDLLKTPDL
jgi:molybdenum cofactor cytidylyltransferase